MLISINLPLEKLFGETSYANRDSSSGKYAVL